MMPVPAQPAESKLTETLTEASLSSASPIWTERSRICSPSPPTASRRWSRPPMQLAAAIAALARAGPARSRWTPSGRTASATASGPTCIQLRRAGAGTHLIDPIAFAANPPISGRAR